MHDVEVPHAHSLFEAEEAGVLDVIERLIPQDFDQGLVVGHHEQVRAALGEILRLLQAPCYREGFAFDGGVTGFHAVEEAGARQDDASTVCTASRGPLGALAPLLHEEVPDALLRPVRAEAGSEGGVEDLHTQHDGVDNGRFRLFKRFLELV